MNKRDLPKDTIVDMVTRYTDKLEKARPAAVIGHGRSGVHIRYLDNDHEDWVAASRLRPAGLGGVVGQVAETGDMPKWPSLARPQLVPITPPWSPSSDADEPIEERSVPPAPAPAVDLDPVAAWLSMGADLVAGLQAEVERRDAEAFAADDCVEAARVLLADAERDAEAAHAKQRAAVAAKDDLVRRLAAR